MNVDARRDFIYQIRTGQDKFAGDVVMELTNAVWKTISESPRICDVDSRDLAEVYMAIIRIFQKRCSLYKDCGNLGQCESTFNLYKAYPEGEPEGPVYILNLRGGLIRFVKSLSDMACRRFRKNLGIADRRRSTFRDRLQGALHRTLSPYLYYNKECFNCPARSPKRKIA